MTALLLGTLLLAAPDRVALAKEYFEANEARRGVIRAELTTVDVLTAAEVAHWRKVLLKLASRGKKLRKRGTNYWYGKKLAKQGKYMSGGGGRGGLVIALHGGGKGQGDCGGAFSTFSSIASKFKCACVAPEVLEKTERGWTTSGTEEFVLELIGAAKRTWKIDPNRVYIVGHSMGGFGSWTLGAHHVDLFAGIGPYAGGPVPITEGAAKYGKVLGLQDGVVPNLRNVALHVYQSLDDKNVPPDANIFANKTLLEYREDHGGYKDYKYVEVDGRGHGAPPGGHIKGFEWLYKFPRDPRPKYILWQPVLSYKRMFYWVWWDRPAPRVEIVVRIVKQNEIEIDLAGADRTGFRILLDDRLVDLSREVVVREGEEVVFKGKVPYTLSTMLMTAAEKNDSEMLFPARIDLR